MREDAMTLSIAQKYTAKDIHIVSDGRKLVSSPPLSSVRAWMMRRRKTEKRVVTLDRDHIIHAGSGSVAANNSTSIQEALRKFCP